MITFETDQRPSESEDIVRLVYFSMVNRYTRVSSPIGLTFSEVRKILSKIAVTTIQYNGRIVGILNDSSVDAALHRKLNLPENNNYHNIGMIYIDKKERGNGFGSAAVLHMLSQYKNVIYVVHESNKISNRLAIKYFKFLKKQYAFNSLESYNVYYLEQ